ncbi:hypothetical protein [uncultured marine virus]|uniref:CRESS-DNA virus Rep endonuclease domain-containing protein n=1 Tax=uncultured marine virus TaxID=186617 RepID=S4TDR4_9VIRU|nr:hypothetical protein [uncultured marine virus]
MSSRNWMFTLNNPTVSDKPMEWKDVKFIAYQREKGDNGTPHYQGYLMMEKKVRLTAMKKLNARANWQVRKGSHEQAVAYVTKEDTRIEGPWEKGDAPQPGKRTDLDAACQVAQEEGLEALIEQHPTEYVKYHKGLEKIAQKSYDTQVKAQRLAKYEGAVLRPWQQQLLDKIQREPNDRTIMWYWEDTGNVGKTWFGKYLRDTQKGKLLDCSKKVDLAYMLRGHTGECVVFNIVRSMDEQYMQHVYGLCEAIKDDCVVSTKYEPCDVPLLKQHVVVFANIEPDYTKWSDDRYDVVKINDVTPFNQSKKRQREPALCEWGCKAGDACMCAQSESRSKKLAV